MLDRDNPFDVLGIKPGATDDEIKSAYERMKRIFSKNSILAVGLYSKEYIDEYMNLVEDAFSQIASPDKRQAVLDRFKQTSSSDVDADELDTTTDEVEKENAVVENVSYTDMLSVKIDDSTQFSGALLKQIRQEMGVELQAIAQTTKISTTNLGLIEDEVYEELPATVYLKGFLSEYAKYLKLPHKQVVESYIARMMAKLSDNQSDSES